MASQVAPTDRRKQRFGRYALSSGVLGATASCCAKFALDPDSPVFQTAHDLICTQFGTDVVIAEHHRACYWIAFVVGRGFCLVCMIFCNGYMLGTFLRGMEESGSVAGTALSTAANFLTAATYGCILWNERFTLLWWVGFTMVCVGVALLSVQSSSSIERITEKIHSKQE
jgi:drug/metabolite transporter (DMT)-like permease